MARYGFLSDFLQSYPFWLVDVGPIDSIGLPVLFPLFGFSEISAPQVSLTVRKFREGNYYYTRKVIEGAETPSILLQRGAYFLDSDFWRWTVAAIEGDNGVNIGPTPRRNLLLVHFFSRGPFNNPDFNLAAGLTGVTALAAGAALFDGGSALGATTAAAFVSLGAAATTAIGADGFHPRDQTVRVPARAWILQGCLPVRYKSGSDFDAMSSDVSIQELELEYERFEEISLAA